MWWPSQDLLLAGFQGRLQRLEALHPRLPGDGLAQTPRGHRASAAWNAQAMVKLESHTTWVSPLDLGLQVETHVTYEFLCRFGRDFFLAVGWILEVSNVSAFSCQPRSQKLQYPGSVSFD